VKISEYLQKKVIPNGFFVNFIIFAVGALISSFIINNKTISSTPALIITGIAYMVTGVGVFGLIRWMLIKSVYLIRLILWGNIEVTVAKEKVEFKPYFKK
jgi:uncharacterized membrane protein YjjP (DUF1212 family)